VRINRSVPPTTGVLRRALERIHYVSAQLLCRGGVVRAWVPERATQIAERPRRRLQQPTRSCPNVSYPAPRGRSTARRQPDRAQNDDSNPLAPNTNTQR
jgi:hypothetical protein